MYNNDDVTNVDYIYYLDDALDFFFQESRKGIMVYKNNLMKCDRQYIYDFVDRFFTRNFRFHEEKAIDEAIDIYFKKESHNQITLSDCNKNNNTSFNNNSFNHFSNNFNNCRLGDCFIFNMNDLTTFLTFLMYHCTQCLNANKSQKYNYQEEEQNYHFNPPFQQSMNQSDEFVPQPNKNFNSPNEKHHYHPKSNSPQNNKGNNTRPLVEIIEDKSVNDNKNISQKKKNNKQKQEKLIQKENKEKSIPKENSNKKNFIKIEDNSGEEQKEEQSVNNNIFNKSNYESPKKPLMQQPTEDLYKKPEEMEISTKDKKKEEENKQPQGEEEDSDNDKDEYNPEVEIPIGNERECSLPKVDIKSGEEDEDIIYTVRARLFRWRDNEWKERGTGDVRLLSHKVTKKVRFIMRQDKTKKAVANFYITEDPLCKLTQYQDSNKMFCFIAYDCSEPNPAIEKFVIKLGNSSIAKTFKENFLEAKKRNEDLKG